MENKNPPSQSSGSKRYPVQGAPKKGPHGEDLVVEMLEISEKGRDRKKTVVKAQGIVIESYNDDGRGLDRAWSILMAMTPG